MELRRWRTVACDRGAGVNAARTKFVDYQFGKRRSIIAATLSRKYFGEIATGRSKERAMSAQRLSPIGVCFGAVQVLSEQRFRRRSALLPWRLIHYHAATIHHD